MDGIEIRISMHAGPVYEKFDPILGKSNFFGTHVNQAARIEPIVLPGSVFVSETVAAMLSLGYEGLILNMWEHGTCQKFWKLSNLFSSKKWL